MSFNIPTCSFAGLSFALSAVAQVYHLRCSHRHRCLGFYTVLFLGDGNMIYSTYPLTIKLLAGNLFANELWLTIRDNTYSMTASKMWVFPSILGTSKALVDRKNQRVFLGPLARCWNLRQHGVGQIQSSTDKWTNMAVNCCATVGTWWDLPCYKLYSMRWTASCVDMQLAPIQKGGLRGLRKPAIHNRFLKCNNIYPPRKPLNNTMVSTNLISPYWPQGCAIGPTQKITVEPSWTDRYVDGYRNHSLMSLVPGWSDTTTIIGCTSDRGRLGLIGG